METVHEYLPHIFTGLYVLLEIVAIIAAIEALLTARTSQGAIAWSLFLVILPFLALPVYLIFGGRKFSGYINTRRCGNLPIQKIVHEIRARLSATVEAKFSPGEKNHVVLSRLAFLPFFAKNKCRLLINGEATFTAIFNGIDSAKDYVLVQFYSINDDELGRALQKKLIQKASESIRVYLLYDAIGSYSLPDIYLQTLRNAGVEIAAFRGSSRRGGGHPFRINFRNHRKIVVVDGHTAYVGGHNVGDEYMSKSKNLDLRPWRDTHVEVYGPAALGVQLAFLEDWNWASGQIPEVCTEPVFAANENQRVLVLPSGPADELDTCSLLFTELINSARHKVWIVSPYFVPDETVISALQLAALRGVDVRIMLPEKTDNKLIYLAMFTYLEETLPFGINVYSYQAGFLHQKVVLVDDEIAGVGTANFDNRSFRLNFEITLLFLNKDFVNEVQEMLEDDFSHCRKMDMNEIEQQPIWFKLATKIARLFSPVL